MTRHAPGASYLSTPIAWCKSGEQVMRDIAQQGKCVIVGRDALFPAGASRRFSCLSVSALGGKKIRRIQDQGRSLKDAEDLVDTVDRADWPTRSLYHLMINTAMGEDNVISVILETMGMLERAPFARG